MATHKQRQLFGDGFVFVFAALGLHRSMLELYFSLSFHKFNDASPKYAVHLSDYAQQQNMYLSSSENIGSSRFVSSQKN
jgi:hypothetical protein